jgi:hypothetical protein
VFLVSEVQTSIIAFLQDKNRDNKDKLSFPFHKDKKGDKHSQRGQDAGMSMNHQGYHRNQSSAGIYLELPNRTSEWV